MRIDCVRTDIDARCRSDHRLWRQLRPERHVGLYETLDPMKPEHADIAAADEWKNDPRNPNAKSGKH